MILPCTYFNIGDQFGGIAAVAVGGAFVFKGLGGYWNTVYLVFKKQHIIKRTCT